MGNGREKENESIDIVLTIDIGTINTRKLFCVIDLAVFRQRTSYGSRVRLFFG